MESTSIRFGPYIWGAVVGAALVMILGFTWGGWTTAGGAKAVADKAVEGAYVKVCARDMLASPEGLAALKTKQPRDYDDAVRDAWKPVGFDAPGGYQFRRACGDAIQELMKQTAQK
jgi:hypothetical protein